MHLPHRRLQHPRPLAIALAKLAVGVPVGCAARYSVQSNCSVTPGRFSSRCTSLHVGTTRSRPAGGRAKSRASSAASSSPAGSGQVRPAPLARSTHPTPCPTPPYRPRQWPGGSAPPRISTAERREVVSSGAVWLPSRGSLLTGNLPGSRTTPEMCSAWPESLFTMPGIRVHLDQNRCSRWPESLFSISGIGVHVESERAFTMDRNTHKTAIDRARRLLNVRSRPK